MKLSNSKVKTWRRCPKKFEFKYEMGLTPKTKGYALTLGDWMHQILQVYYTGGDWQAKYKELKKGYNSLFVEEREKFGPIPDEVLRLLRAYLYRYHSEDKRYKVIAAELDETLDLPNGDKFNFIIDLIVEEDDGSLWLWDHKFVSSFMPADFLLLDTQLARYFWGATKLGFKGIRGVIMNECRTKPPAIPGLLQSGGLSKRKNIDTDVYTYRREIAKHGLNEEDYQDILHIIAQKEGTFFRRSRMPKDKPLVKETMMEMMVASQEIREAQERGRFPRTPLKQCTWDCEFLNICLTQYFGGDISSQIKSDFDQHKKGKNGKKRKS